MSNKPLSAERPPRLINTLTSDVTEHQGMKIINRPEGVVMAWESEPDLDMNAMAKANGFSNVALETTENMMTGETRSVASVEMSHEEYETFRNQPHVRPLELPAMVPEATSNTLGQLTFMPSASDVRAEYANPPEPAPEGIGAPNAPPGERSSERLTTLKAQREANKNQLINPDAADDYVRFDDLNQSVDELIGQIKGEPGTLTDYAAQATRGVLGFTSDVFFGVGELVYEGGKLAVDAAQTMTPSGLQGQVLDAQILMEEIRLGNITSDTVLNNTTQMASAMGQSVAAPVTEPWNNGQYVEAVTRGGAEIASLPLVVLKGNKLNKAAKAADAASDASNTARAAGTAQDTTRAVKSVPAGTAANIAGDTVKASNTNNISKVPHPKGPKGNGGKVVASKKMKPHKPKCFKPGKALKDKYKDNPNKMEKEFYKQLKAQEDGINKMTVGDYTRNRGILNDLTEKHGHEKARGILTKGGKAQTEARKQLTKKIKKSIIKSLERKGVIGKRALTMAAEETQKQMSQLAALHDPDLIAGGNDTISRVGNKSINSSLGSQWAKDGRVDSMDKAAEKATLEHGPDTSMNVKLERCKN